MNKIKILVVGCGNMGISHALAYHELDNFEIVGLVSRGKSNEALNKKLESNYPLYNNYEDALSKSNPNAVCICTYPDTHEKYAIQAFEQGCHVFLEKPIAETVQGSKNVVAAANKSKKKLSRWLYTSTPSFLGKIY